MSRVALPSLEPFRLHYISKTGVDSGGLEGAEVDSVKHRNSNEEKLLRRKTCAIT